MKALLLTFIATTLFSVSASADVIKCTFTEPFVDVTYNTATETLVEYEGVMQKTRTLKNISFEIKYAGTFLLKDSKGKLVAELKLNNNGSDGMSDAVYPYEVSYKNMLGMANSGIGGCTSKLKPMVKKAQ